MSAILVSDADAVATIIVEIGNVTFLLDARLRETNPIHTLLDVHAFPVTHVAARSVEYDPDSFFHSGLSFGWSSL